MNITLNGKSENIERDISLSTLIENYSLNSSKTIAMVNDVIVKSDLFNSTTFIEGDKVELLAIVGGG